MGCGAAYEEANWLSAIWRWLDDIKEQCDLVAIAFGIMTSVDPFFNVYIYKPMWNETFVSTISSF